MKNGKLIQMNDIMCPVDWDLVEFEKMMVSHLKKDEFEWKFYDALVKEWNAKYGIKKSLAAFLKFMLDKVEFFCDLDYVICIKIHSFLGIL